MKKLWFWVFLLFIVTDLLGQCDPFFDPPLSIRNANYNISLTLDHTAKTIEADQTLTWINISPDTLNEMRFYMYLNAFKNTESTFLKGATQIFGQDFTGRKADEWGWISIDSIGRESGQELTAGLRYIQPNDGNEMDQTVLQVPLDRPVLPGDTLVLHMKFTAKMPKIIVRSGYSKDDYFLFVHWFPQAGVYQVNLDGKWGWNCHQFHRMTEFFADFGSYDVSVTASNHLVLGASGCLLEEKDNGDGTITHRYHADDVIDFAWVAYPYFEVFEDRWEHVGIRLLIPPEHRSMAGRYIHVIKHSLAYLTRHVGRYPYPSITIVDPPLHALRSGLMEYPTFITAGTFYNMPAGIKTSEALAAHEFAHQYFMAMVASNEKEEAWLDEGFVTYFEDRIVDDAYGEKTSLFDLFGYRIGSGEQTRQEYVGMPNPKIGEIARPSWEFTEGRKGLIYSKTATSLHTIQRMVGDSVMDRIIQTYFERWKFRHPKGTDFLAVLHEVTVRELGQMRGDLVTNIFRQCIYGTDVCDYAVGSISNYRNQPRTGLFGDPPGHIVYQAEENPGENIAEVTVYRLGEMIFPQEIVVFFEDGSKKMEYWTGEERTKIFKYQGGPKVVAVHIDPEQKIYLDLDLNNNSYTLEPDRLPLKKYAAKAIFWIQQVFQVVSFLF